jgi:hypothetical protein
MRPRIPVNGNEFERQGVDRRENAIIGHQQKLAIHVSKRRQRRSILQKRAALLDLGSEGWQRAGVIRKSVMNMAKRGGGERHMCGVLFIHWRRLDELPQGQPEFALKVRSGRKAPARRHDRRPPLAEVSGDGKFPSEALGGVVLSAHDDPGDGFEAPPENADML